MFATCILYKVKPCHTFGASTIRKSVLTTHCHSRIDAIESQDLSRKLRNQPSILRRIPKEERKKPKLRSPKRWALVKYRVLRPEYSCRCPVYLIVNLIPIASRFAQGSNTTKQTYSGRYDGELSVYISKAFRSLQ